MKDILRKIHAKIAALLLIAITRSSKYTVSRN